MKSLTTTTTTIIIIIITIIIIIIIIIITKMMIMILVIILCTKVYTSTSKIIKRHLKNKKSLLKDVSPMPSFVLAKN